MTKSYKKICKRCGSQCTKKDGTMREKQRYKCTICKYIRVSSSRISADRGKNGISKRMLYEDWSLHKQTYRELSKRYGIHRRTVQRYLDEVNPLIQEKTKTREIILIIDTTYFGDIGLMVFKDKDSKKILHYDIVHYETNDAYKRGVMKLQDEGWIIRAIVCDGRRGLLGGFKDIPTQMCHFHQTQIVRRNITKKPVLEENKELKKIVDRLPRTDEEGFRMELERWYSKYHEFIQEKGVTTAGKSYYIHKKTRSAYLSLKRNLKYLFIYQDYLGELDIPNTTNAVEGMFSQMKYKINLHRGLRIDRKLKLIRFMINSR